MVLFFNSSENNFNKPYNHDKQQQYANQEKKGSFSNEFTRNLVPVKYFRLNKTVSYFDSNSLFLVNYLLYFHKVPDEQKENLIIKISA